MAADKYNKSVEAIARDREFEQYSDESFDLNGAIGRLYEDTNIADPSKLAELLLPSIPLNALHDLARDSLRTRVRIWFVKQRGAGPKTFVAAPDAKPAAVRAFVRSIKLDAYGRILAERYHVGSGHDDWKVLGDCGEADLAFVVEERKGMAARNLRVASRVEHLIASLRKHKAKCVRDLPRDAVLAFREDGK